jgi:putative transferase (TIGR04331 family)
VPGDTLAFMEFFRTPSYREYLDATLAGTQAEFAGRTETAILEEAFPARVQTVTFTSCLPRKFRYLLQLLSFGKIRNLENKPALLEVAADWTARDALADRMRETLLPNFPQVAQWLSLRVRELFPKSLLEHLTANLRRKLEQPARKVLFSADGWQIIDDWKIYALAQKIRHEATWLGTPNAVGHGSLAVFWQREFEAAHLDTYLSWGWSMEAGARAKVLPFYCPNFAGMRESAPVKTYRTQGVLISSAARPQHLLEYPYTPERFERYLNSQLNLADAVQRMTQSEVCIRTRPRDLGWDVQRMVRSLNNPSVTLEFQQGRFTERLKRSWLHICDNCSTTIVESLSANHPTMILIDGSYFQLHPNARHEYSALEAAGVFHASAASLLTHYEAIQFDVAAWWENTATQYAVREFLRCQGRIGSTLSDWRGALLTQRFAQSTH